MTQQLAVNEALKQVQKERDALANELEQAKHDKQAAAQLAKSKSLNVLQKIAGPKDAEIQALKAQLDAMETTKSLAITQALSAVEKERDQFKLGLERSELEMALAKTALKDKYESQIKDRDDQIELETLDCPAARKKTQ